MHFSSRAAVALLFSAAILGSTTSAATGGRQLFATLSGGATGDPDGSGTAMITVNPGQGSVCFELDVSGIEPAFAAHIHLLATGGIVVPLEAPTSGHSEGCVEGVDRQTALAILKRPADYYVNVHTSDYPGGAIRGTLG